MNTALCLLAREAPPPLIAWGYLLTASRLTGPPLAFDVMAVCMLGALCVYGVDHGLDAHQGRSSPFAPFLWTLVAAAGGWIVWTALRSPHLRASVVIGYILLACLYVFPWFPGGRRLQDFPRWRTLAICLGWTALPLLARGIPLDPPPLLFMTAWCGFLAPNVWLNDAAHAAEDQRRGRPTWAGTLSLPRLRRLCLGSLILSAVFFAVSRGHPALVGAPILFAAVLLGKGPLRTAILADWILCLPLVLHLILEL